MHKAFQGADFSDAGCNASYRERAAFAAVVTDVRHVIRSLHGIALRMVRQYFLRTFVGINSDDTKPYDD
jgi:hypothetical protein